MIKIHSTRRHYSSPVMTYCHCEYICDQFKGALYGIEPSTRNSKIWSTREKAAPSVPKNILLNLNQT